MTKEPAKPVKLTPREIAILGFGLELITELGYIGLEESLPIQEKLVKGQG